MTVITNAPRLPGDQPFAPLVAIELLDDSREPVVGYVSGTDQAVYHRLAFAANGQHALSPALSEWAVELEPNAAIEPAGTVYRITEQRGRALAAIHIIEVPESGGPYTVLQTLIDEPGSMGSLLLSHLVDLVDAHDASAVSVAAIVGLDAGDAQAALAELIANDTAEATARASADALLATSAALGTETTGRVAGDAALAAGLADEATARASADALLATAAALTTETTARVAGDAALAADLADEATARAGADTAEATARATADSALATALGLHESDETGVHGIADTSALVVDTDPRLDDERVPTDNSVDQSKVAAGSLGIDRLAVDPRARATHTGTQLAATISDLTTAVRANRLDQMAAPAASVDLNGQRLTNGALPVAQTDVITKEYADALRAGLLLKADPVRVMVDTNVNINAPGAVLDSAALGVDDRVLLTGQTSANDNGIYLFKGAAVPMVRAADANTSAEMRSGTAVWVAAGTYQDQRWALITADPVDLGVTAQVWSFDGGLAHTTAGDGLTKTGNRLDVGEGTGLEVTGDAVGIAAGGVGTTELADGAATDAKVAPGVAQAKISGLVAALAALGAADTAEAAARSAADALLIPLTQRAAANGVATLGADTKVPRAQLPDLVPGVYLLSDYGTITRDGTGDNTAAVNAAHAAMLAADEPGGILEWGAGRIRCTGKITLPNDGTTGPTTAHQPPITWRGVGGHGEGQSGGGLAAELGTGGTRVILTYQGDGSAGDAKVCTYGSGLFTLRQIVLQDTTANSETPFLYTTATTLDIDGTVAFLGATMGSACKQDAIVLGGTLKFPDGPTGAGYTDPDAPFQGYGTKINGTYFDRIRRAVLGRSYVAQLNIHDIFTGKGCGTNLADDAQIVIDASLYTPAPGTGGEPNAAIVITGGYFEVIHGYAYGVKLINTILSTVASNGFEDTADNDDWVAAVRMEGVTFNGEDNPSQLNMVFQNLVGNGVSLSEDAMSAGRNDVIGNISTEGSFLSQKLTLGAPPLVLKSGTFDFEDDTGKVFFRLGIGASKQWWANSALHLNGNDFNGGSEAGTTTLTIGNNATVSDALIVLNPPDGSASTIQFKKAGVNGWQIYNAASDLLFIRDVVGGVMAITLNPGAPSVGSTQFGHNVLCDRGAGFWGHAAPAAQPAAPVTLGDVIAILQGCGLAA